MSAKTEIIDERLGMGELTLPLVGGRPGSSKRTATLRLILGESHNVRKIGRTLAAERNERSAFLSVQDGSSPVGVDDIVLLQEDGAFGVFVASPVGDNDTALLDMLGRLFERRCLVRGLAAQPVDMMFVWFSGEITGPAAASPDATLAWVLDRLQGRGANPYLTEQLTGEILGSMPEVAAPMTRGLFSRLRADALSKILQSPLEGDSIDWSEIAELYRTAADEFRRDAFLSLAAECGRRAMAARTGLAAPSSQHFLPGFVASERSIHTLETLRFCALECLGVTVTSSEPVEMEVPPPGRMVRRRIGTLRVDEAALMDCVRQVETSRLRPAVTVNPAHGDTGEYSVHIAWDQEHLVLLGLAGRGGKTAHQGEAIVTLGSPSCETTPRHSWVDPGGFAEFNVKPRRAGRHRLRVSVVTPEGEVGAAEVALSTSARPNLMASARIRRDALDRARSGA